ncbi:MAG: hypothetical protein ACO1N1_15110 [Dyadobacter fermentans]
MEKQNEIDYQARLDELLLKDRDRIYNAIKNSPFLRRKNEEAAASLAKLPRPLPWEKPKTEDTR